MDNQQTHFPQTSPRLNFFALGPDAVSAMGALDQRVLQSDLEKITGRACAHPGFANQRLRV
jgi:hypothetical protein